MKRIITFVIFLIQTYHYAYSQNDSSVYKNKKSFYITTNAFASFASLNILGSQENQFPHILYKTITGISSNFEYGININSGLRMNQHSAIEARLSTGLADNNFYITQLHCGYNYFVFNKSKTTILQSKNESDRGLYLGLFLKFWDQHNRKTDVSFYHLIPYINIGYQFISKRRIIFDIRLSQTFAVVSWSNLEHTTGGADYMFSHIPTLCAFVSNLSFNIGYSFGMNK